MKGQIIRLIVLLAGILMADAASVAAVYEWEWVDPNDHGLGKKESSILIKSENISAQNIEYANWTKAYLPGANLFDAYGYHVIFDDAYLVDSNFESASLIGASTFINADLEGANLRNTYLYETDFSGANFRNADLNNAGLLAPRLVGANFAGAHIRNMGIPYATSHGFTSAMLYSTASYQEGNLSGISLYASHLSGWDLSCQNLTNAWLGGGNIVNLNLSRSDLRGAHEDYLGELNNADTANAILPDGKIDGLNLNAGEKLSVWDYDGYAGIPVDGVAPVPPLPIRIEQEMMMSPDSTLKMLLEADDWNSVISFAPDIPVSLGGELELTFAPGVDPASQIGRTFDLFDWTGVLANGEFGLTSPYAWDVSELYTSGEVTLLAVPESSSLILILVGGAILFFSIRTHVVSTVA